MSEKEMTHATQSRLHKDLKALTHEHAIKVLKERPGLASRTVMVCVPLIDIAAHDPCLADVMNAPGVPDDARPLLALASVDSNVRFLIASEAFDEAPEGQFGETWICRVADDEPPQVSLVPADEGVDHFILSLPCAILPGLLERSKRLNLSASVGRILNAAEIQYSEEGRAHWAWVNPNQSAVEDNIIFWLEATGAMSAANIYQGGMCNRGRVQEGECAMTVAFDRVPQHTATVFCEDDEVEILDEALGNLKSALNAQLEPLTDLIDVADTIDAGELIGSLQKTAASTS